MKRYEVSCDDGEAFEMENGRFYLTSDVDARIAELEKALKWALEGNRFSTASRAFFGEGCGCCEEYVTPPQELREVLDSVTSTL